MRHRLAGPLAVAAAVMALDRVSKIWINRHVSAWDVWPVIPGYVNIIHAENPGMAFSLLATASETVRTFVLIGLAGVVLVLVAMMLWRSGGGVEPWALALVLGGAVGNLWDRLERGTVTDFVDFYIRNWHWATFNVADSAITAGAILLGWHMLTTPAPKDRAKEGEPAARVP